MVYFSSVSLSSESKTIPVTSKKALLSFYNSLVTKYFFKDVLAFISKIPFSKELTKLMDSEETDSIDTLISWS